MPPPHPLTEGLFRTDWLCLSEEVATALRCGTPVVALESSIFAQGFPAPDNRVLCHDVHAAVAAAGAVAAATAVVDGKIRIGLHDRDIERLTEPGARTVKCSARDLAVTLTSGGLGATTVAATARIAAMVGIAVFATGGIGGVHRGMPVDVSADLMALSRLPVAVVSSGAKSILDLGATFEALDALGVPVIGYACSEFPAFHSAESGIALNHRVDDPATLVAILKAHWALPQGGGVLVCNPPPKTVGMPAAELDALVAAAVAEAQQAGIRGDAVTPYVLAALNRLSDGRTLDINRALALDNARLASEIAVAWATG